MDIFKIKYIPDIFPNFSFEDELVLLQEVTELPIIFDSFATSQKFGITYDNVRSTRIIQSVKRRAYTVKVLLSRNIDVQLINLAYTTMTTTAGETFVARDIAITHENVSGSRNIIYTINFFRYDDTEILNNLASHNVLSYFTETAAAVNVINFEVDNPSLDFSNVTTYKYSTFDSYIAFKVPINSITTNISIGDEFYTHTSNETFDNLKSVGQYYNYITCYDKDSDYVYFYFAPETNPAGTFIYILRNITLDHEQDWRGASVGATIDDKTFTFNIYTHINPILSSVFNTVSGIQFEDETQENQKIVTKKRAYFKFWLSKDELYLYEMLQYAKASDVTFTLYDGTIYVPVQMGGITTPVENENLIDVYEFDCNLMYTNKQVNYFR